MILKVAELGHPVLRAKAEPVDPAEIGTPFFQRFLDDMTETMREYEGVGLAAPQVHVSRRIFCVESSANGRYPGSPRVPLYTVINPVVRILEKRKVTLWEGCLSVPDLRGPVERASKLELTGLDRRGKPFKRVASGFHARIVQHELDHLDGCVYLDRMHGLEELSYIRYLK